MKLAIAAPSLSVYSETFIRQQYDHLPCSLRILGGPLASESIPGGKILTPRNNPLNYLDFDFLRGIRKALKLKRRDEQASGVVSALQAVELKRRMKKRGIDIVLANFGPAAVSLLPVCREARIPLVVHFHGADAHRADILAMYGPAYADLGQQVPAVIAVSQLMVRQLEQQGIPSAKIHLVRYGVTPMLFKERGELPTNPRFLGVGRFTDKKAPYLTVLAFRKVHAQYPDARLALVGDGELLESTRNLVGALGLTSAVEFLGVLPPKNVAIEMQRSTAFVQHSIAPEFGPNKGDCEGTPVAVLEAMMSGLPVIATRHAGIGDVVKSGCTGVLFAERDVDAMASAMVMFVANPQLALQLGRNARAVALEKFTTCQYVDSLLAILEKSSCPGK